MNYVITIVLSFFIWTISVYAYEDVTANTLAGWMQNGASFDFILLDVRDSDELSTVIANDTCRPYNMSWNDGIVDDSLGLLPKKLSLVVYCRSGNRSSDASAFLESKGFTVYNLAGGITSWNGPTGAQKDVRPLSDLPEPSMRSKPLAALGFYYTISMVDFTIHKGPQGSLTITLAGRNKLEPGHILLVHNTLGKQEALIHNPFVNSSVASLKTPYYGHHLITLRKK